jgi:Ca-activated chloride channel family protein
MLTRTRALGTVRAALAAALLAASGAQAQTALPSSPPPGPPPTVLIVDSSGSMAAQEPDGRAKLDAARGVLAPMLEAWPAEGELAVVAYGHRREADCADIETLVPLGPVAPAAARAALDALRARGKTPISGALQHAAGLLPPDRGSILLVSDGIETCEADPCAVAAALRRANPRLLIHVVGFGLAEGEAAQLSCVAANAGGRFFDAGTAADLATALTAAVEAVAAPPSPAPPPLPAPVPEPPEIVRIGLAAVAGGLGRIVDAPVRWTVRDSAGEIVYEGESRALSLDLAEGRYAAVAKAANAQGAAEITVSDDADRDFEVELAAGRLDLALAPSRTAPPFSDLEAQGAAWTLEPQEGQGPAAVPPVARPSLLLAPGRYRVAARLKGLEAAAEAEVVAGAPTALTLDFRLGTLVLEAALAEGEPAIADAALLGWRVGEGSTAQTVRGQARPRLVLPEGRHPVRLSIAGGEVAATAEVRAGEERVARVIVEGGELALSARLAPGTPALADWRDTFWSLAAEDGPAAGRVIDLPEAAPTVPLPPGRWRVSLQSGTVAAERRVTVGPGDRLPLEVSLDAARLTLRAAPAHGAAPAVNTVFQVVALGDDGTPAETPAFAGGAADEVSTIVRAGRWRVIADDSDGRHARTDVVLAAGEERTLDLPLE